MCSAKAATSAPGLVPKQISTGDRTIIEQHNGLARIKSGACCNARISTGQCPLRGQNPKCSDRANLVSSSSEADLRGPCVTLPFTIFQGPHVYSTPCES